MKDITFLSLFSGIGGLDLGLERAGMRCVAQVEISRFCRRVLAKHWPDVPKFKRIEKFHGNMLHEKPTVIAGGFPCQDISVAGKRIGINGSRSGLWFEYLRIIREIRPAVVLVENVQALLVRGITEVLGGLAEIGYDAEWECVKASEFGAPHHRERVFILAHRDKNANLNTLRTRTDRKKSQSFAWWRGRLDELGASDGIERGDSYAGILRAVDGIPAWVDRVGAVGNAVCPPVAEWIGRRIVEALQ